MFGAPRYLAPRAVHDFDPPPEITVYDDENYLIYSVTIKHVTFGF